jgi:hypothetical protein
MYDHGNIWIWLWLLGTLEGHLNAGIRHSPITSTASIYVRYKKKNHDFAYWLVETSDSVVLKS